MLDLSIAERIKEARNRTSMSQLEISQKLEITDKTYRNYEKGKDITVGVLKKIAEITNTDFDYLLKGKKSTNNVNRSVNLVSNADNSVLINGQNNSLGNNVASSTIAAASQEIDLDDDTQELCQLLQEYGSPKMKRELKEKLLQIKALHG